MWRLKSNLRASKRRARMLSGSAFARLFGARAGLRLIRVLICAREISILACFSEILPNFRAREISILARFGEILSNMCMSEISHATHASEISSVARTSKMRLFTLVRGLLRLMRAGKFPFAAHFGKISPLPRRAQISPKFLARKPQI